MAAQEMGLKTNVDNPTPIVHEAKPRQERAHSMSDADDGIDALEVLDIIRTIKDPEYPYTLEQLNVVSEELITVDDKNSYMKVMFTPTVEHCSLATLIGLCIRVKLLRTMPSRFKVDIFISPGAHETEDQVNKQLNDKERYSAAMENPQLRKVVDKCLIEEE